MDIAKKFLLLGGVLVGVLAIANCAMVTITLIRSCKQLPVGRPCDLFELGMFMLVFLVPGLLVCLGSFVYFTRERFWGLGLHWVGGFVNELLVILFFVGLVIAFQDVPTIFQGVILEFLSIIPVLVLSFVLLWLQRRNPTSAWSGLAGE